MNKHQTVIKDQMEVIEEDKKKGKEIFKFSFSSLISFLIDYSFYSSLLLITHNIIIANIIARIISSICNFSINKKLVFKSSKNIKDEIIKYYSLVIIILILNTIILKILSNFITPYIAKIIVEILLFIINYIIQKKIIFKGSDIYKK